VNKSVFQLSFLENTWSCSDKKDIPFEQKDLAKDA
jgi:hypothetical protein